MDCKTLVLQSADPDADYPIPIVIEKHFELHGKINSVEFVDDPQTAFIVTFDDQTTVDKIVNEARKHIIKARIHPVLQKANSSEKNENSSQNKKKKSSKRLLARNNKKTALTTNSSNDSLSAANASEEESDETEIEYDLYAMRFSEYLGQIYSLFGTDEFEFQAAKTYVSRVHGLSQISKKVLKEDEEAEMVTKDDFNALTKDVKQQKRRKTRNNSNAKGSHSRSLSFVEKFGSNALQELKDDYDRDNGEEVVGKIEEVSDENGSDGEKVKEQQKRRRSSRQHQKRKKTNGTEIAMSPEMDPLDGIEQVKLLNLSSNVSKVTLVDSEDSVGLPDDLDFQLDRVEFDITFFLFFCVIIFYFCVIFLLF